MPSRTPAVLPIASEQRSEALQLRPWECAGSKGLQLWNGEFVGLAEDVMVELGVSCSSSSAGLGQVAGSGR